MNILLGVTGSVAATVAHKVVEALESAPNVDEVRVIMTEKARMFVSPDLLRKKCLVKVYTEEDEWQWVRATQPPVQTEDGVKVVPPPVFSWSSQWRKGDPILHVELSKWASCLVIAPATANTLSKMANGACDNLLTSVFLAWRHPRPVVVAPAMNSMMWASPMTEDNLRKLKREFQGLIIVPPVEKELACGDVGVGAMADAAAIGEAVSSATQWIFPMHPGVCPGIPVGTHPGAFGGRRKHKQRHCGVDLYASHGDPVFAVESGVVVAVEDFTGPDAGCPWWLPTKAVKIEGASGVVCYGEISPKNGIEVGDVVDRGQFVGWVVPVLPPEKARKEVPGHSCCMLHFQLYPHGVTHKDEDWGVNEDMPDNILDPTPLLQSSFSRPAEDLDMPGWDPDKDPKVCGCQKAT